jgi:hypothetical protein
MGSGWTESRLTLDLPHHPGCLLPQLDLGIHPESPSTTRQQSKTNCESPTVFIEHLYFPFCKVAVQRLSTFRLVTYFGIHAAAAHAALNSCLIVSSRFFLISSYFRKGFILNYVHKFVCLCGFMHKCSAPGGQKMVSDPVGLELQLTVS